MKYKYDSITNKIIDTGNNYDNDIFSDYYADYDDNYYRYNSVRRASLTNSIVNTQSNKINNNYNNQSSNDNNNCNNSNYSFISGNSNNNNNNNNSNDNSDNNESNSDNIKELGTPSQPNPSKEICFLSIIGEIEGHNVLPPANKATKYEHIIPQIIGAELDPEVKGIMLLINTVGGDVEAGLAISELISSISKPTVSIVLGGGHSIGNALAVSTNYSFIVPTGSMTIHPIRTNGFVIGVPQTFRYFQKMQERITKFICDNSHVDKDRFTKYMYDTDEIANDVGTVLDGEEVVELGLIDEIGGFESAMKKLRELINKKS